LTFNNHRTIEEFAGAVASQVEFDSLQLLSYLESENFLEKNNVNREELLCLFLPNTYEVYWNMALEKLVNKLILERKKFWDSKDRRNKAEKLGLDPKEVCTLAAIVCQ